MAFHNTLTQLTEDDTTQTSAAFMNAKFAELLDNDVYLKENHKILSYSSLTDLELTDADFEDLTQVQALDLLISNMADNSYFQMRLTGSENNFRLAIAGSIWSLVGTGIFRIDVTTYDRYYCTVVDEGGVGRWTCEGYPTFSSEWVKVATQTKIELTTSIMKNNWELGTSTHNRKICKIGDVVTIDVLLTPGTLTANTVIMQLPEGYRPSKNSILELRGYDGNKYNLILTSNGNLTINSLDVVDTIWYQLSGQYIL